MRGSPCPALWLCVARSCDTHTDSFSGLSVPAPPRTSSSTTAAGVHTPHRRQHSYSTPWRRQLSWQVSTRILVTRLLFAGHPNARRRVIGAVDLGDDLVRRGHLLERVLRQCEHHPFGQVEPPRRAVRQVDSTRPNLASLGFHSWGAVRHCFHSFACGSSVANAVVGFRCAALGGNGLHPAPDV